MTLQSIRSTPPAVTFKSAKSAMALDDRTAPTSSKPFTRSSVNADRSGASTSSVKDRNPPPTPEMAKDVQRILEAASQKMRPGEARKVDMNNLPFMLYRTRSGDGLVMQRQEDYYEGLQNGLFIGLDSNKQPVMLFNKQPVATPGAEFGIASRSLGHMLHEFKLDLS